MGKNRGKGNNQNKAKSRDEGAYLTEPLTKKQVIRQAKTVRRLALGPEKQILKGEERASNLRSKEIKQWFPQYGEAVEAAAGQTADAYRTAGSTIGADTSGMAAYAETLRQRLGSEAAADATLRGAANDTSGSTLNAEAQLARIGSANTLSSVIAGQGASQGSYLADKKRIGSREKIKQLSDESDRRMALAGEKKQLARQGRDIVRDELARLKDAERDYALGLQAASTSRKGQKLDARAAAATRAETRRHNLQGEATAAQNANTSASNAATSRQGERRLRRDARYDRRHPNAGESSSSEDKPGISVREALGFLRTAPLGPKGELPYSTDKEAIDYLINRSVEASVARAAVKKASQGSGSSGYSSANAITGG